MKKIVVNEKIETTNKKNHAKFKLAKWKFFVSFLFRKKKLKNSNVKNKNIKNNKINVNVKKIKNSLTQVNHANDDFRINDQFDIDDTSFDDAIKKITKQNAKLKKRIIVLNRRQTLNSNLYRLINEIECCKKIEFEFFDENKFTLISKKCKFQMLNDCCNRCSFHLNFNKKFKLSIKISSKRFNKTKKIAIHHRVNVKIKLKKWRTQKISKFFSFVFMTIMCSQIYVHFFFTRIISNIVKICMRLKNANDLKNIVRDWKWIDEFQKKIWQCVQNEIRTTKLVI